MEEQIVSHFATLKTRLKTWRLSRNYRDALLVPIIVIGLISASFVPLARPTKAVAVTDESVTAYTNRERITHGLAPLVYDETLEQAAFAKAEDMVARQYFGHYFDDQAPWDFIIAAGDDSWHYAGENLAKNYTQTELLVTAWMDSPTHRANILNANYSRIGVAVVTVRTSTGEEVTLTVQLFTGA